MNFFQKVHLAKNQKLQAQMEYLQIALKSLNLILSSFKHPQMFEFVPCLEKHFFQTTQFSLTSFPNVIFFYEY